MYCPSCGAENRDGVNFCARCGNAFTQTREAGASAPVNSNVGSNASTYIESYSTPQGATEMTVNVQVPKTQSNPLGVAGFIVALIGVFTSWVPILGWILWALGGILSIIGVFKRPRGLAIAGVVLTFIDLIVLLLAVTSCSIIGGSIAASI